MMQQIDGGVALVAAKRFEASDQFVIRNGREHGPILLYCQALSGSREDGRTRMIAQRKRPHRKNRL
jgi:hypothetical protein